MKRIIILIISIIFVFVSCKKDNSSPTEPTLPSAPEGTEWKSSTLNSAEIGGSNLNIITAHNQNAAINNGNFKTIVSQDGIQILFVIDGNKNVRGLSYTIKNGSNYEITPIDATSTLNALFLLIPGLTTTSSTEANDLFNKLSTLTSYNELINYIKQNLLNKTLGDLLNDSVAKTLLQKTVSKYSTSYFAKKNLKKTLEQNDFPPRFSIIKSSLDNNVVELSNEGLRKVNVYRCYQDNNQITATKKIIENMDGAVGASWGSLLTLTTYNPTVVKDESYSPPTQTTITEYWVIGPGKAQYQELPPSTINLNYDDALGQTIINYFVYPFLDIVTGGNKLLKEKIPYGGEVWNYVKGNISLEKLKSANDVVSSWRETINISLSIVNLALASSTIVGGLGLTAAASDIAIIMGSLGVVMGAANVVFATVDFFNIPPYEKFILGTPPDPPTLALPINKADNISTSPTLSWNTNPIATSYMLEVSPNNSFNNSIFKENIGNNTSEQLYTLSNSTEYFWRVSCTNNNGTSKWSDVWSFTTSNSVQYWDSIGTVTDIDGNVYKTVKIGNQWWTAENLKVTHYANGTVVENGTGKNDNIFSPQKYWWVYNDDASNKETYGLLYSWEAVMNGENSSAKNPSGVQGIAPNGWHIPSDTEWKELEMYLGMSKTDADKTDYGQRGTDEGNKLKEEGDIHWKPFNGIANGGTNTSGFTALPGGRRSRDGIYDGLNHAAFFWTTTNREDNSYCAYDRFLYSHWPFIVRSPGTGQWDKSQGFSVRCVKDR